jgi:hypothetical protein
MKTTTGCTADYTAGYDAGYKAGFIAGDKHAQTHEQARKGLLPLHNDGTQAVQDYMDELLAEERADAEDKIRAKKAAADILLNGGVPVYQGRDNLCASCGKPVGDSPVQKQEYSHIFLYCSENCRDYHAVGA